MLEIAAQQRLLRLLRPASSAEIGAVAPPEWPAILAAAAAQRLVPLLGRAIRNAGAEGQVPESVRVAVREATVATAFANLRRSRVFGRLLAALETARIPIIVLKGLALAELVYRDVALRPMSDVDVLVGDSDFDAAVQVLFAAGFASDDFDPAIGSRGHPCHIHLRDPAQTCVIELHWRLSLPTEVGQIDLDEVWSRSRPVRLAAGPARVLATEDLILSLAEHVAKHRFARGSLGLFDIDETVRRHLNEIEWREVVERARRWGVARSAYVSFWLAHAALGTPVPDEVTSALRPADFDSRVADLFQDELMSAGAASDADGHFGTVQFWYAKGAAARARLVWQSLFPPRQLAAQIRRVPANSPALYLYYLARPFQVLARNGRFALRLAVRRASVTGAASRKAAIAEWLGRR